MEYYLFKQGDEVFYVHAGELVSLGEIIPTPATFLTYGVSAVDPVLVQKCAKVTILAFSTEINTQGFILNSTHIWEGQTVVQKYDFDATEAAALKIEARVPSSAIVRCLISVDSGATWGTISSAGILTPVALSDISTAGMSIANVIALNATALTTATASTKKLRLAFYLKQTNAVDKIYIDYVRFEYKK